MSGRRAIALAVVFGVSALAGVRTASAATAEECVLAHLQRRDAGPGAADLVACGGDAVGEVLAHATWKAPDALVRGCALLLLPDFVPDEAAEVLADVLANPNELAWVQAKAMAAALGLARVNPAAVLDLVRLGLRATAPFVRELAIRAALALPGRAALPALEAHRVRERARWLMPFLKEAVATLRVR